MLLSQFEGWCCLFLNCLFLCSLITVLWWDVQSSMFHYDWVLHWESNNSIILQVIFKRSSFWTEDKALKVTVCFHSTMNSYLKLKYQGKHDSSWWSTEVFFALFCYGSIFCTLCRTGLFMNTLQYWCAWLCMRWGSWG